MEFNPDIVKQIGQLADLLKSDTEKYIGSQSELAKALKGKESDIEDIVYDYADNKIRLEAMMITKIMPSMPRLRIFEDLAIAEQDPDIRKWAAILFRQEHLLQTADNYFLEINQQRKDRLKNYIDTCKKS